MDEAKLNGDDPVPVTKPSVIKDIVLTALLTLSVAGNGLQISQAQQTTDEIVASLAASGKVCELAEVTDNLALTTDSIRPAYDKITAKRYIYDSTGKKKDSVKADTVHIAAGPILSKFRLSDNVSDYEFAKIVPIGSTLRINYILDGIEVDRQLIRPTKARWLISTRTRASLYTGK